jgi:signal transduction histidine kinase/CheY-like chemotaxis protein
MWRNIAAGRPWRGEICNRAKDGSLYWVDSIIAPFKGEDGRSHKYLSIRTDITQRKLYEQSLREGTLKAEQANQAKSEFLANMSHEIRTPMNAVIGLAYLLGQTQLDEEQGVLLSNVQFASKTLLGVLNNVLDLAKIEAGELIMEHAAFSVRGLLQDVTEMAALQADAKGITFEIDTAVDLPAALEGDATRLIQVLTNLLSNAIKFTEHGGVTLRVRRLAARSDGATLSFAVQDTGIGIAPGVQEKLFTPFTQADVSITRRFGGTGLGLSIVKRLVGLMAGEVRLLSTPGVGSEFTVILDFAPASPAALAALEAAPAAPGQRALLGVRVLVVDDSDINLQVTRRILELEGAQVRLASNGLEAFELLRGEPNAVDVVLMDVQMPVLNGHDATRRIRLELGLVKLPMIALTAGALSSERQRATASGMDDYIVKPFGPRALVACILRRVKPAGILSPIDHAAELAAQTGMLWPVIEGIDAGDVRERLAGDRELFRSMLMGLLGEFTNVACPSAAQGPGALALHAARMHKLRGSAGTLGAKAIQRLAGDAEAAAIAGQVERATELATTLTDSIQKLHDSALNAFDDMPIKTGDDASPGEGVLDPQSVVDLIALLRRQSLSAIGRFGTLSGPLRRHLGLDSFRRVRDQVNDLQFAEAADALEANQTAAATA